MVISAAIIVIGDEILSGRIADQNVKFIASHLQNHGIVLEEVAMIPDKKESISSKVNEFRLKYNYVFTTGGIGPTHDDITAESIAEAFGVTLEINQEARQILIDGWGAARFSEIGLRMARIPHGASLIKNSVTFAPGFYLENVYVMAGVPNIMQSMLLNILDKLESDVPFVSFEVKFPCSENVIATILEDLQNRYPSVQIGSYPYTIQGKWCTDIVIKSQNHTLALLVHDELKERTNFLLPE